MLPLDPPREVGSSMLPLLGLPEGGLEAPGLLGSAIAESPGPAVGAENFD
jgi:hypothetical protein